MTALDLSWWGRRVPLLRGPPPCMPRTREPGIREGKPEDSSLATITGPAVDVVPYQEDEEPETDEEDETNADE